KKWTSLDESHQGLLAKADLPWQGKESVPSPYFDEFAGIDLETLQKFYNEYTQEKDLIKSRLDELIHIEKKVSDNEFDPSMFTDGQSIQEAIIIKAKLQDEANYSTKERALLKKNLKTKVGLIKQQIEEQRDLMEVKLALLHDKLSFLQKRAIE